MESTGLKTNILIDDWMSENEAKSENLCLLKSILTFGNCLYAHPLQGSSREATSNWQKGELPPCMCHTSWNNIIYNKIFVCVFSKVSIICPNKHWSHRMKGQFIGNVWLKQSAAFSVYETPQGEHRNGWKIQFAILTCNTFSYSLLTFWSISLSKHWLKVQTNWSHAQYHCIIKHHVQVMFFVSLSGADK